MVSPSVASFISEQLAVLFSQNDTISGFSAIKNQMRKTFVTGVWVRTNQFNKTEMKLGNVSI